MKTIERKNVLNAGAGSERAGRLHPAFDHSIWRETRLDIDPAAKPDLIGSICQMGGLVRDGAFDALWSSHTVEHLHAHDVASAFREFRRVVKPEGFALITCPDLAAIARLLLDEGVESIAYHSPAGPIRPLDMLYGHGASIAEGHRTMAHNTGFTGERLARVALEAGFTEVRVLEGDAYDLWAIMLAPRASLASIAPMFNGTPLAELFAAPCGAVPGRQVRI